MKPLPSSPRRRNFLSAAVASLAAWLLSSKADGAETPPDVVTRQGWRQTAIFICVIARMVTEPIHASALVLIGLTAWAVTGTPMRAVCRAGWSPITSAAW